MAIPNDVRISRLAGDDGRKHLYRLRSTSHGTYVLVIEGGLRYGDTELGRRDSLGISGVEQIEIEKNARMQPTCCLSKS